MIKFSNSGDSILWSTFLDYYVEPVSIDMNKVGQLYIGENADGNLTTTPDAYQRSLYGYWDAFVLVLSSDGSSIPHATYIGGRVDKGTYDLVLDENGNPWIVGGTTSFDYPHTISKYIFYH
ncbi:MAG: hypothetical protein U9R75_07755 [Candidatus Thermoplasmatota archaeon]|nr:hypothetical protein [Candidatus Thermoplasmatota archaeon]